MQRISPIRRPRVPRPVVQPADHTQARSPDGGQQVVPSPQPEPLRQVRQDEPALTAGFQLSGQSGQEAAQHAAVRVVDALFEGRGRPRRDPGRIAHHQAGGYLGVQLGATDPHDFRESEPPYVPPRRTPAPASLDWVHPE